MVPGSIPSIVTNTNKNVSTVSNIHLKMGAQPPLKMLYIKPQKMDNVQNSVPIMNQLLSQTLTEPLTHNVSEVGYTSTFR
jgi:hypothetical protein